MILPTGIATDATTQYFFKDLVQTHTLVSLFDFENRRPLFEGVDSRYKFCLLTLSGRADETEQAQFAFFAHDPADLNREDARFELTPDEIQLLNPNTGTCPIFRTRRDAEITLGIYRRVPVLINENDPVNGNPWGISFMQGLFNMTSDSHLFHTREDLEDDGWELIGNVFERELPNGGGGVTQMLPLYEAKMLHIYDTRWATYEPDGSVRPMTEAEKAERQAPLPRYWVAESEVDKKLEGKWDKPWLLGWRDIARATDERTIIATKLPRVPVGNKFPVALPSCSSDQSNLLQALLSSRACDYVARQKIGGASVNYFLFKQIAVPTMAGIEASGTMSPRSVSRKVDRLNGWVSHDAERRELRAELDAWAMTVYGVSREDCVHMLGTFPNTDGDDLILRAFDAMMHAKVTGADYQTPWNEDSDDR